MSQPIQERVDELISGIRTECAIKLFGDDLDLLYHHAERIADLMRTSTESKTSRSNRSPVSRT